MQRTLILGGGFGGISVAAEIRARLGADHEIVMLDRRDDFMMGLRKLWALVGIGALEEGRRSRARLNVDGVRFHRRTIQKIDPVARRVETDEGTFDGDFLVVAVGAEPRGDLVPGFLDHAHNLFDPDAIPLLAEAIARFERGRIAIAIAGVPYKCPPSPYECAMLLEEHLRGRAEIVVTTPQPILLPNAGADGSKWLAAQLAARGIKGESGRKVERFEKGRVVWSGASLDADLLIGVPPHRPPAVVKASGLTGDGDWIKVDPGTLATDHPRVFAIGDCTQITLANGLPLPKAGIMAESEGKRVGAAIAADARGEAPPPLFDGRGFCFIEMGKESASMIEGEFFATPDPRIALRDPSAENAAAKRRFEAERLAAWFK